MPSASPDDRLLAAIDARAEHAGRVLERALALARPAVLPEQWTPTDPALGLGDARALTLGEEKVAPRDLGEPIVRRLLWLEDGRLVDAWWHHGAFRVRELTGRQAIEAWALPGLLHRLAGRLGPGPTPLDAMLAKVAQALEDGAEALRDASS